LRKIKYHNIFQFIFQADSHPLNSDESKAYWDSVSGAFASTGSQRLWRVYSDRVNATLLGKWLDGCLFQRILKTDLFDEAVSGGLFPVLKAHAQAVYGMDISLESAETAKQKYPDLEAHLADVRRLPFKDGCFERIVSNSTLDHFEAAAASTKSLSPTRNRQILFEGTPYCHCTGRFWEGGFKSHLLPDKRAVSACQTAAA
jgi:hypothetical protein